MSYKVGDMVIRLDFNSPYIYTIQRIDNDGTITIVRKKKSNSVKVWGTWVGVDGIRLATPKEIEQGFRDE